MNFKESLQEDLDTFLNVDEFAEIRNIDGADIPIQIDNDLLKERQAKFAEGTYLGDVLFLVKKSDFGDPPAREQIIKLDNEPMRVTDFQENMGIYTITLEAIMS
ncbi:hypothetical protein [Clostridium magnum]|uniref:Uncharacterized protein n=1 Tax=Clostridium magnum DSM 2767 TaxID=1121326 RepID=A0A162QMC5_9CLOT|nr:hypothetical protein [Clostridium magnum]KZL88709.1 hypothetical protein CLMAG_59980 [Clostridium magnum DSM 2767]SHJ44306.1 hypothetical protein SAMN02745944_05972 [Clostridium magnum DSM 2767]